MRADPGKHTSAHLKPGFSDPVHDSQATFNSVMQAMARPGRIRQLDALSDVPSGLFPSTAAVLLALVDFDSSLWFDSSLGDDGEVVSWTTFHTGAPIVVDRSRAAFAVVSRFDDGLTLADFHQGEPEFPDRSTTLIVQVDSLGDGDGWKLTGPGIQMSHQLLVTPVAPGFLHQWTLNREGFPLGVDIILCAPQAIACLPRTVNIEELQPCM